MSYSQHQSHITLCFNFESDLKGMKLNARRGQKLSRIPGSNQSLQNFFLPFFFFFSSFFLFFFFFPFRQALSFMDVCVHRTWLRRHACSTSSATGVRLTSLPSPTCPSLVATNRSTRRNARRLGHWRTGWTQVSGQIKKLPLWKGWCNTVLWCERVLGFSMERGSKTHNRLNEHLWIGRNRTKCANFGGSPLFWVIYNRKPEKQTTNSIYFVSVGCGRLAEFYCIHEWCSLKSTLFQIFFFFFSVWKAFCSFCVFFLAHLLSFYSIHEWCSLK